MLIRIPETAITRRVTFVCLLRAGVFGVATSEGNATRSHRLWTRPVRVDIGNPFTAWRVL